MIDVHTLSKKYGKLVANDGESNWLEGVQLIAVYLIIAVSFFIL